MNDRTTLILVIIAAALALLVIFLEHDVSTVPFQSPERFRVLRGLKQENVERISLLARGGTTIHLRRASDRWFFKRPLGTEGYAVEWEADAQAVNRLVDALVDLREAAPAIEGGTGSPLDDTGLNDPEEQERIEVMMSTENGSRLTRKLYLGNPVPDQKDLMYVKLENDDAVLKVENTLGQMMKLAREGGVAFRSKNVFPRNDLVETDEVYLETASFAARFEKVGAKIWQVSWKEMSAGSGRKSHTARGSGDTIKDLAEAMQKLQVERFVADTTARGEFQKYGLLTPRVRITLTLSEQSSGLMALFAGSSTADLRIGKEVENAPDQVYAMANRLPMVFTMKKAFLDKLPKKALDLPARRLVTFESSKVTSLDLTNAHGTLRAKKKDYEWTLTEPMKIDGDHSRLNALIDALTTTDCEDVEFEGAQGLRAFGLVSPSVVAKVRFEYESPSGKKRSIPETIQFGKVFEKKVGKKTEDKKDASEDKDEKKEGEKTEEVKKFIYARRVGDVAVRVMEFDKFKEFQATPLSFFKKRVMEFNSWDAKRFTLTRPDGKYEFKKEDQDWLMITPASLKADAGNVGGLVSSMAWLNADTIVAGNDTNLAAFGLDKPTYRLEAVVKVVEEKKDEAADKSEKADDKDDKKGKDEAGAKKKDHAASSDEKKDEKKPEGDEAGDGKDEKKPEKTETYELTIAVKKEGDKDVYYAHGTGSPLVFTVEKSFVDKLEAEVADTDIFPFQWSLRQGVVESEGRVVRLTRDADGKAFKVSADKEGELQDAEAEPARKFFEKLGGTKVQKKYLTYEAKDLAPFGLDKNLYAVISSVDKEEKTATLEVGKLADKAKHGEGLRYARRAGRTAVFLVKQEDLDALTRPMSHYLSGEAKKKAEAAETGPMPKKPPEEKKNGEKKADAGKRAEEKAAPGGKVKEEEKEKEKEKAEKVEKVEK
jgi:hypothetical protein